MASSSSSSSFFHYIHLHRNLPLLASLYLLSILIFHGQQSPSPFLIIPGASALELHYYSRTCPNAEKIVRSTMEGLLLLDITASAALLRLVFHDCQVKACDASILLADDPSSGIVSELHSDKNFGIRRLDFIDLIKEALERECPHVVSCSDIIVLAGRDAIAVLGGPQIPVLTGRKDSLQAYKEEADAVIPSANSTVDDVFASFRSYGLTVDETVALLGSHTLGVSHCVSFRDRLEPEADPEMNPAMARVLRELCSSRNRLNENNKKNGSRSLLAPNDATSVVFDVEYFKGVKAREGLLRADAGLRSDGRTAPTVARFAADRRAFFDAYTTAFLKFTQSSVLSDSQGQIRHRCPSPNTPISPPPFAQTPPYPQTPFPPSKP